uniref:Uncharacterized protein n=1 Tax=Setaria viridis TaxID=4556 RepID=A0A4V6D1L0_SETVI|nr:hypothetical protein SEVIR_9G337600v2 [Setaria viridis]
MSTMKKAAIQELVNGKLLQEEALVNRRSAYANAWQFETHPKETVMWAHFVERGLAVPTSEFFRLRNSDAYLEYETLQSHGNWKEKWFYIGNHNPPMPVVTGYHLKYSTKWLDEPSTEDSHQIVDLLQKIAALKKAGLTGVNVAASFLKRRIQPLQLRPTWGYEYSRLYDLSRMSPEDISNDEVEERLGHFLRGF